MILKEKAQTSRARALARTLEVERDAAREMVFKFMDDRTRVKRGRKCQGACHAVEADMPPPKKEKENEKQLQLESRSYNY